MKKYAWTLRVEFYAKDDPDARLKLWARTFVEKLARMIKIDPFGDESDPNQQVSEKLQEIREDGPPRGVHFEWPKEE